MYPQQLLNSLLKAFSYVLHNLVVDIDAHNAIDTQHPEGDSANIIQSIQDHSSGQINLLSVSLHQCTLLNHTPAQVYLNSQATNIK